jgi:hypothetical protein
MIIKGPGSLIDTSIEDSQPWRMAEIDAATSQCRWPNVDWHRVMKGASRWSAEASFTAHA